MERSQENITVAVRIRPLQDREAENSAELAWEASSSASVKETRGTREFVFDRVYGPLTQTTEVFNDLARVVVEKCMQGYNGCVFCYGQTGSGKTFTMHGQKKTPGLVPQAIEAIFAYIQRQGAQKVFLIRCSYIEIYNESVNDLLDPNQLNLQLAEDSQVRPKQRGIKIVGATEEVCASPNQVQSLLVLGETHKNVASTSFNQRSSRAHSV
jgi:hypothetical protein